MLIDTVLELLLLFPGKVTLLIQQLKAQVLMKFVIHFVSLLGKLITLSQMHHEVVLERYTCLAGATGLNVAASSRCRGRYIRGDMAEKLMKYRMYVLDIILRKWN